MFRFSVHRIVMIMLINMSLILVFIAVGQRRYHTLMIYSQTRFVGFSVWDLQSEITHVFLPVANLNLTYIATPAWSPDGNTLAFVGRHTTTNDGLQIADNIYLVDANGRNARLVLDTSGNPIKTSSQGTHTLRWSPDGEKIALYLDLYGQPNLWIINRDGTLLTQISSRSPLQDDETALPINAELLWSADSDTLYVLSLGQSVYYQTVSLLSNASLTIPIDVELPQYVSSFNSLALAHSPVSAEIAFINEEQDTIELWRYSLESGSLSHTDLYDTDEVTALAWSPNGAQIGWVSVISGASFVNSLSVDNAHYQQYILPDSIARDRSYQLWLTDTPEQVVVRMQRGSLCRNIGQMMRCFEPDTFSPTWYGIQP